MAYNDKSSQWSIAKETTFGDKAGFNNLDSVGAEVAPTAAEFVELINPSLDAATEMIDREILKNSLVKAQPLLGKETSSGSMEVELSSATGTAGAKKVNGDLLYESAIGKRISDTVAETSGVTIAANVITVADSSVYEVGQAVKVTSDADATLKEFAVVRELTDGTSITVAGTTLTDNAVTDDANIEGLVSFVIATPDAPQISLAAQEYFEGASQSVYTYGGVVASDVSISYPVANIAKANFSLAGAGFDVANDSNAGQTVTNREAQCVDLSPYISKNMTFTYAGNSYDIENLDVKVASELYDSETLTSDGISQKTTTGKSEVSASFGLEYTGTTLFDIFQAGTSGELFGAVSNASTASIVYAPKVILTEASKSTDSGIYKESVSATFLSSGTCTAGVEDAITIAFA